MQRSKSAPDAQFLAEFPPFSVGCAAIPHSNHHIALVIVNFGLSDV